MIKKVLSASLIGTLLMLSGCGNSEGESALETQYLLDKGQFDAVIKKVEPRATTSGDYLTLASAYMGKSGFSLTSVVGSVSATNTNNGDEFSSFVNSAASKINPASLEDIGKAIEYYKKVVGNKCTDDKLSLELSAVDSDICLYIGLANVSQSAVAISYIADDVAALTTNAQSDDKLTASACAMQYAFNGTSNFKCTVLPQADVTFTSSQKTYQSINVIVNAKEYEYLLTSVPNGSSVITKGYCSVNDFTTRVDIKPALSNYHVCPITQNADAKELTTESVLISAMNSAFDSIGAAVTADMKKDIDKFKAELLKSSSKTNGVNTQITTQDIINYFNDNNK